MVISTISVCFWLNKTGICKNMAIQFNKIFEITPPLTSCSVGRSCVYVISVAIKLYAT